MSLFGSINLAMPFLLNLIEVPEDLFQLFLATLRFHFSIRSRSEEALTRSLTRTHAHGHLHGELDARCRQEFENGCPTESAGGYSPSSRFTCDLRSGISTMSGAMKSERNHCTAICTLRPGVGIFDQ